MTKEADLTVATNTETVEIPTAHGDEGNKESAIIVQDSNKVTDLAPSNNVAITDNVETPFGPWIFVKRYPKNKERLVKRGGNLNVEHAGKRNQTMNAGGSRFITLIEDEMRVRNNVGGKNPHVRGPKHMLGQAKDKLGRDGANGYSCLGDSWFSEPTQAAFLMNILSWNCIGTGNKGFANLVKDIRRINSVNLVFLYETHANSEQAKNVIRRIGLDGYFVVDANGHSGGIWCLWDSDFWKIDVISSKFQFVQFRRALWEDIRLLASNMQGPWCFMGDFNSILHDYEQSCGSDIASGVVDEEALSCTVNQFVNNNGWWNQLLLNQCLPASVGSKIMTLAPPTQDGPNDTIAWNLTVDGLFSIRTAYDFVTNADTNGGQHLYKLIWRWEGPQRIRCLLWKRIKQLMFIAEKRIIEEVNDAVDNERGSGVEVRVSEVSAVKGEDIDGAVGDGDELVGEAGRGRDHISATFDNLQD
ncbi:hypothetical protein RIF29_19650 [Crotalaria pallida]|uniref:Endonuclease/exonuclease/phosphatase domain-containing protein n=1 Tax=Crotalaria pallida TaxID=3830 RepID=A0AAN9F866_CROPI